jgi:hypothetical protein
MRQALWLAGGGKVSCFDLSNLTTSEDMYLFDEVSESRTLKVGGITLKPMLWGIPTKTVTTSKIGLWQVGKSMYDWAENLTNRLILSSKTKRPIPRESLVRIFNEDREWVADDSGLIDLCLQDCKHLASQAFTIGLVSDDVKLARRMASSANVVVLLASPEEILRILQPGTVTSQLKLSVEWWNAHRERKSYLGSADSAFIYMDTGSIMSAAAKLEYDMTERKIFRKTLRSTSLTSQRDGEKRKARYEVRFLPRLTKFRVRQINPVTENRYYRPMVDSTGLYSESSYEQSG